MSKYSKKLITKIELVYHFDFEGLCFEKKNHNNDLWLVFENMLIEQNQVSKKTKNQQLTIKITILLLLYR